MVWIIVVIWNKVIIDVIIKGLMGFISLGFEKEGKKLEVKKVKFLDDIKDVINLNVKLNYEYNVVIVL